MSKIKRLIESAVEKRPLDIKEMVDEIMREKIKETIVEEVYGFEYGNESTEEDELQDFFEEFYAEYGHLPIEEQEAIMEELLSDDDEELNEDEIAFLEAFEAEYGHLSEEEQEDIIKKLIDEAEYNKDAVDKQIRRDGVKPKEAELIHALLKGRKDKRKRQQMKDDIPD